MPSPLSMWQCCLYDERAGLCLHALHVCACSAHGLTQSDLFAKPSSYSTVVALTDVVLTEPIDTICSIAKVHICSVYRLGGLACMYTLHHKRAHTKICHYFKAHSPHTLCSIARIHIAIGVVVRVIAMLILAGFMREAQCLSTQLQST